MCRDYFNGDSSDLQHANIITTYWFVVRVSSDREQGEHDVSNKEVRANKHINFELKIVFVK
jgi:hypothetical protein